jgi:hypothetical protein
MIKFLDDLADLVAAIVFLALNVGVVVVIAVIILGIVFDSDGMGG